MFSLTLARRRRSLSITHSGAEEEKTKKKMLTPDSVVCPSSLCRFILEEEDNDETDRLSALTHGDKQEQTRLLSESCWPVVAYRPLVHIGDNKLTHAHTRWPTT